MAVVLLTALLTPAAQASSSESWAVVTGASAGIGAAAARQAAARGYNVLLAARRKDHLQHVADEISAGADVCVECVSCDLSRADGVGALCAAADCHAVRLAVLNAGVCVSGGLCIQSEAQVEKVLALNVHATTALLRHFGHTMSCSAEGGGTGRVLLIASSAAAAPGIPGVAIYAASKAYLRSLAQGARAELRRGGGRVSVSVTCALPSAVDGTEFSAASGLEGSAIFSLPRGMRRLGGTVMSAEAVAKCALDAALSGRAEVVPGLFPRLFVGLADRRLLPPAWTRGIAAFCFADAPFGPQHARSYGVQSRMIR